MCAIFEEKQRAKPNQNQTKLSTSFVFIFCSLHNTTLGQTCNKRHAAACGKCRRSQRQKYFQFRDSLDSLAAPRRNYKKSNIKKEARKNKKLEIAADCSAKCWGVEGQKGGRGRRLHCSKNRKGSERVSYQDFDFDLQQQQQQQNRFQLATPSP